MGCDTNDLKPFIVNTSLMEQKCCSVFMTRHYFYVGGSHAVFNAAHVGHKRCIWVMYSCIPLYVLTFEASIANVKVPKL